MAKTMYVIGWYVRETGRQGQTERLLTEEQAMAEVKKLNKLHRDVDHWIVPVTKK